MSLVVTSSDACVSGQNTGVIADSYFSDNFVSVQGSGEIGVPISTGVAPTVALNSGGSYPTGSSSYVVTFVDANGNQSSQSNYVNFTVLTGTQTVVVTPPAAPIGALAWMPYRCAANGLSCSLANISPCSTAGALSFSSTFTDSYSFGCGESVPTSNKASAQSISAAGVVTNQILLTNGFKDTLSGTFTANRVQMFPDASGPIGLIIPTSFTTTSGTSDNVTVTGMTASGHCVLQATNSTADSLLTGTYVSAKTTNQITVTHAATAGGTFDIFCSPN